MKKLFVPSLLLFVFSQAIMFYAAVARLNGAGAGRYFSGYAVHFIALFLTAFLIVFTLKQVNFRFPYFMAILYCTCAAIVIEFIQQSLPYRTFSVEDMFFGVFGAVTFVVIAKMARSAHAHLKA